VLRKDGLKMALDSLANQESSFVPRKRGAQVIRPIEVIDPDLYNSDRLQSADVLRMASMRLLGRGMPPCCYSEAKDRRNDEKLSGL
jgi:hypothetical protein